MVVLAGIDPGVVDTGWTVLEISTNRLEYSIYSGAFTGKCVQRLNDLTALRDKDTRLFIEKYVPRNTFSTSQSMVELQQDLRGVFPRADFVNNQGSKQIVTDTMLRTLGLFTFEQVTHHQDIRSAARIMLFGALKDELLNRELARLLINVIDGNARRLH